MAVTDCASDDDCLAFLTELRPCRVNGVVCIVVPCGYWGWVRWLHCCTPKADSQYADLASS